MKFVGRRVNELAILKQGSYDRGIIAEVNGVEEIKAELRGNGIDESKMVTLFGDAQQFSHREQSVGDDSHLDEQ